MQKRRYQKQVFSEVGLAHSRLPAVATVIIALLALVAPFLAPVKSSAATNPTIVSITFDDGNADQAAAATVLNNSGLKGTFYITTGWIGAPGYLSRTDLSGLAAGGHEIGAHTVTHPDLIEIDPAEAKRQICNSRWTLDSWGFKPVSFAYPFADANATVASQAADCGFNTSRGLGDVKSPTGCTTCVKAETLPPPDGQFLRAPDQVDASWTLNNLKQQVTQAANKGGWVILTFHHVCAVTGTAACPADQSIKTSTFTSFVSWLKTYASNSTKNTVVRTIDQAVRQYMGTSYPAYQAPTQIASPPVVPDGVNAIQNPSLEATNPATGFPQCFQAGGWGTNTVAWSKTNDAHSGSVAEQLDVSGYQNGDAKLLPTLDFGACSPSVTPGKAYDLSVWAKSTAVTQFALYYRDAAGVWFYWTSSPWFAAASTYTQMTFRTPVVPAGATAITFGLALIANGSLTTDDYSMVSAGTGAAASDASALTSGKSSTSVESPTSPKKPTKKLHSRVRPELPGLGKLKQGDQVAVPELKGSGKG